MTTETITDYETKEVKREVTYSDLSGREIPEGEGVALAIHTNIERGEDGMLITCDGRIDLHVDELAELNGIDPDDIDADSELPEWYVKRESPEVVERPYIGGADIGTAAWWFGMALIGLHFGWIISTMGVWPEGPPPMIALLVVASALFSFVGFWGLLEVRDLDSW